jgi:prophage DNA circulation protein
MGKKWEEFLQPGSLGGVEFDFISTKDQGGRDLDQQEFPGRKGVSIDDRSAKAETHSIVAIFIEEDYPDTMNELLAVLRAGGVMEFVHPVFGSSKVAVENWEVGHDIEDAADAAGITLTLIEHTDAPSQEAASLPAKANAVRSNADATKASADAILDPGFDGPPAVVTAAGTVATLSADASTAADTIEAGSESMSVAEIQSEVNSIRSRIQTVSDAISDYSSPEAYSLGRDLTALAQSISELGDTVIQARPPMIEERVEADIPFLIWVQQNYPDLTSEELEFRVAEVLGMNDVIDPLTVPLGTPLRRYAD